MDHLLIQQMCQFKEEHNLGLTMFVFFAVSGGYDHALQLRVMVWYVLIADCKNRVF